MNVSICRAAALSIGAILMAQNIEMSRAADTPQLFTHQSYVEEATGTFHLPLSDIKGMFA